MDNYKGIFTTAVNSDDKGMNDEEFIKYLEELVEKCKIERKGYILLPSMNGYDLFEIDEERLKKYLAIESYYQQNKDKITFPEVKSDMTMDKKIRDFPFTIPYKIKGNGK